MWPFCRHEWQEINRWCEPERFIEDLESFWTLPRLHVRQKCSKCGKVNVVTRDVTEQQANEEWGRRVPTYDDFWPYHGQTSAK